MINQNQVLETKFQEEVVQKGYNKPISKEWDPKHFNDIHMHDEDFFIYIQRGELVIGVEDKIGLEAKILEHGDSVEVLAGTKHYESVGDEGVAFLVAKR